MAKKTKILIFGSCVSRDMLNYDDGKFQLVEYFARSSLASAFSEKIVEDEYTPSLESPFQRRIVKFDLQKDFRGSVASLDFDVLLIDLIDERYSIYIFEDASICTLSTELMATGFDPKALRGRLVESGTDEFYGLWELGWARLFETLRASGMISRVLINKAYWSSKISDSTEFSTSSIRAIERANKFLDIMYARMSKDLPQEQFITFDDSVLMSSPEHRWGLSPFHYIDEYYTAGLAKVMNYLLVYDSTVKCDVDIRLPSMVNLGVDPVYVNSRCGTVDYSGWQCAIGEVLALDNFLAKEVFVSGIHRISCGAVTLDLFISGFDDSVTYDSKSYLVSFTADLGDRRGRPAPFFSGLELSAALNLPIVSISDPTLSNDDTLSCGWYSGNRHQTDLPLVISRIIERISFCYNRIPMLVGGGSAGFAALAIGQLVNCRSVALVWNPDTNIGECNASQVSRYLYSAFPDLGTEASSSMQLADDNRKDSIVNLLSSSGINFSLRRIRSNYCCEVLYLQGLRDESFAVHAKKYLEQSSWVRTGPSSFQCGSGFSLCLGNWAGNRNSPPELAIQKALKDLSSGISVNAVSTSLAASFTDQAYVQWFSVDQIAPSWRPRVACTLRDGTFTIEIESPGLPCVSGLEYAIYLLENDERRSTMWYQPSPVFSVPDCPSSVDKIRVFLRDVWGNTINSFHPVHL